MPNYTREGKILVPIPFEEFKNGIDTGKFVKPEHKAYAALLYYSGVRKSEARRTYKEQFSLQNGIIFWDVGPRLKHSKETDPLAIPLEASYANLIWEAVQNTPKGKKVFEFSDKTAYNIVRRVWHYPHLFRLTRITDFFEQGRTITQLKSWTGLTLVALDSYAGKVDIMRMGRSLAHN